MPRFRAEIPCPTNNDTCKYQPECHTSKHHLYPQIIGKVAAADALADQDPEYAHTIKRFVNHPLNLVVSCRMIHDYLDSVTPDILPDREYMETFLEEANGD